MRFGYSLILFFFLFANLIYSQNAKDIAKKCMGSTVSLIMEDKYKQPLSIGSGFVVESGKIITNLHVVNDAISGYAIISGSSEKHKISGYLDVDITNDLVLLSVPTLIAPAINFSTKIPEIGEKIYVIGNPKGLSGTISEGIISGLRKNDSEELIQITAPISPGSSGGPVLDNYGQLIGVSVGTLESGQLLNFAIPSKFILNLQTNKTLIAKNLNLLKNQKNFTKLGKKTVESGVVINNPEFERISYSSEVPLRDFDKLFGFTIVNDLEYPVYNISLQIIHYDANGRPLDSDEATVLKYDNQAIKPYLAKYIEVDQLIYLRSKARLFSFKEGEKLEIRVLNFELDYN